MGLYGGYRQSAEGMDATQNSFIPTHGVDCVMLVVLLAEGVNKVALFRVEQTVSVHTGLLCEPS